MILWTQDNVQNWRVHDNLFENLSNDAILEFSGNNEFYNNTFHAGAYNAYISDSPTSHCYNNLVLNYNIAFGCNNTATQITRFQSNWTYQCTTDVSGTGMTSGVPLSNVFGVDPQVISITGGDYHPAPTSPLIDMGNPNIFARGDLDSVSRIVDTNQDGILAPEIGCYEVSPVSMTSYFDVNLGVLFVNTAATQPGMYGFVLFCFNDGLIQFPGQGPILIDQNTYIGNVSSAFPGSWVLNLNGVTLAPGTRIVMQVLALGSAPSVIGGNQVWVQL
jgi:hypothetical protein